jgi:hypothetical protein
MLLLPKYRPSRIKVRRQLDPQATQSYGDAVVYKDPGSLRIFLQNVKGLTYSSGFEDYKYYMSQMAAFGIDCFRLAETNTAWQHYHLQMGYKDCVQRQFCIGKTLFRYPSSEVDKCSHKETFQAGGCLTTIHGHQTTKVQGQGIQDPTDLGRWSGITLEGKGGAVLSIITVNRICEGSVRQAPLGSALVREHEYYRQQGEILPQPRNRILSDLAVTITALQNEGHSIILMMDANGTVSNDRQLQEMINSCDLVDLHQGDPAPSTYMGSIGRRIDYIFGCHRAAATVMRQGSLAYLEGPQSDHRGLYVDLKLDNILGDLQTSSMTTPCSRTLYSGNPELVEKYLIEVRNYNKSHNVQSRIQKLHSDHTDWKLCLREMMYDADYTATFIRWEGMIQAYDPSFRLPDHGLQLDQSTVRARLNEAAKHLRAVQKQSTSHRQQSFRDLLDIYEADSNTSSQQESKRKAKIVRRTSMSESCRRMFRNIRNTVKHGEYSPLTKIRIPRPRENGEAATRPGQVHQILETVSPEDIIWDTIITKEEMEEHLVHFNREAFRAAASLPCGHGIIHDALTFTSLTPSWNCAGNLA